MSWYRVTVEQSPIIEENGCSYQHTEAVDQNTAERLFYAKVESPTVHATARAVWLEKHDGNTWKIILSETINPDLILEPPGSVIEIPVGEPPPGNAPPEKQEKVHYV